MHARWLAPIALVIGCGSKSAPGGGSASGAASASASGSGSASASASAASGAGAPASTTRLDAELDTASHGKAALLVLDDKGRLVARSVDGSFTRVLAPGPYGDALADGDRELVWLRGDTTLDVLDLRAPASTAVTRLATAPAKAIEQLGAHITEPPTWTMDTYVNIMLSTPCSGGAGLRLDWSKGGVGTTTGGEGVQVVAKDWFVAQAQRARRPGPGDFSSLSRKPHKVPKDVGTCHADAKQEYGRDTCGAGVPFGRTGVDLVIVGADADKCPAQHCQLFDPKTKTYKPVPGLDASDDAAPSCGPFVFDRDGTSYLTGGMMCGLDGACTSVGTLAVGWLEANRLLDLN